MMKRFEVKEVSGNVRTYVELEGLALNESSIAKRKPENDLRAHLDNVRSLDIRDDDVYVATYVKSGTHWVWEILSMLRRGEASYEENVKEVAMLEFITQEEAGELPSPRILNCHYPLHLIPEGILKKKCKIVHVRRNLKDVMVSYLHHVNAFASKDKTPPTEIEDVVSAYLGEHGFYLNYKWTDYIREWEQLGNDNPEMVLNLTYEDMKKDAVSEIKKMSIFLGLSRSDALIQEIADMCSFKNLKKANKDVKKRKNEEEIPKKDDFMYRKGEVGDWKNWFTVAQNEKIDRWLEENLKDTDPKLNRNIRGVPYDDLKDLEVAVAEQVRVYERGCIATGIKALISRLQSVIDPMGKYFEGF